MYLKCYVTLFFAFMGVLFGSWKSMRVLKRQAVWKAKVRRYFFNVMFFFFFFFFFQNFHSHSFCISHTPHRHPEPLIYQSPADSPSPFVQPANNNSNNKKHPQEDLYIYLALWESQCKYLLTTTVFFFFFFSVSALKYRRDGGFLFYMLSSMASKDPKS